MGHKKAANKQILNAYGQSYKLMQEAKRYDDEQICNCKNYTLEEIFYLKMNINKCPRCKIKLS